MDRCGRLIGLCCSGCTAVFGIGDPDPTDTPASTSCVIGSFDVCANQTPNGPITFDTDTRINTTLDCSLELYEPQAGSICVIFATDIVVAAAATVVAFGSRPLVLAATGAITIDGTIDVSSYANSAVAAGANNPDCAIEREPLDDPMGGGGGAAGGSFVGTGGAGGMGAVSGGLAGDPITPPAFPRGGCPGGASLFGNTAAGGGAVWVVAGIELEIGPTGRVLAGGAGGLGGANFGIGEGGAGGGGGGSGGFILGAAPSITIDGVIIANGGGGGEGGIGGGGQGNAGVDGVAATLAGAGGAGSSVGGDGGNGASGSTLAGAPGSDSNGAQGTGGGGGGGGAGAVVLTATTLVTTSATISPPPM